MSDEGRPLWDRGEPLDAVVERFTVGRDPELDLRLLPFDALGSAAHAVMLAQIGVLEPGERDDLLRELGGLARQARQGQLTIARREEDCHTAIENRLTEALGDVGRRIHTGRSRNDQVIAALRLWGREQVLALTGALLAAAEQLFELAARHGEVPVAGYTHTRQAMPSTMGHLLWAHGQALLEELPWLQTAFAHLNRSPLGSASGYGVPLALDRQLVARLLCFDEVQRNTIAVQNDRGRAEFLVLGAAAAAAQDLGRLAADLIWFSTEELGYVELGAAVTTGSSIMPQKRNPDVLELIRASAGRVRARQGEVGAVWGGGLASGYHRDLQLTKEPFMEGLQCALDMYAAVVPVLETLRVDEGRCRAAMTRAIGATDAAYGRVAAGEPFRTAYKAVAADPERAVATDPAELWRARTHEGAPGALDLAPERQSVARWRAWHAERREQVGRAWELLVRP